jgi:hypothetical protein
MTHPTNNKLEAMAVKFEQDHWFDAVCRRHAARV